MSRLEQLKGNQRITAKGYQAPGKQQAKASFRFTRGHWVLLGLALVSLMFITFITLARSIQVNTVTADLENPDVLIPQSAEVQVLSWLKLPVGNRVMLLPGAHEISVAAKGFESLRQSVDVGSERYHQFEVQLVPLPGSLKVNLNPAIQADVLIDDEPFAQLPGLVENVSAGMHKVTIDAPLYREYSEQLVVQGRGLEQSLDVSLQAAWAEVSLDSQPAGATVLIDGVESGQTPLTVKVEEGTRELALSAGKYKPIKQQLTVVTGQNLTVPAFELQPADGVLEVVTEPAEAAVIVNGEYRGVSPMSLALAPDTAQQLQVYRGGYQLVSTEVTMRAAEQREQQFSLKPDLVNVRVSVKPGDASIYVDGVLRGQGSQTLSLTTLPHKISVRKPGYVSYQNQLIPTKTSRQIVSVSLLTENEYYWANIPEQYRTKAGQEMQLFKSPGEVRMGSSRREQGRRANEVAYSAKLAKHFYVSKHEVTNKQFRAFSPSHSSGNYKKKSLDSNKHPVVNVSWQQAAQYCNWLSKREGLEPFYQTKSGFVSGNNADANGYRLLTEVEWAWLARNKGADVLKYPWGKAERPGANQPIGNFADLNAEYLLAFTLADYDDGYKASSPVGRFPANHRGLYDLDGNASEWVNDWYSARSNLELGESGKLVDPLGPKIGEFHVVRGGSWAKGHLPQLRLAYRDFGAKGKHDIGFRVARYAAPSK